MTDLSPLIEQYISNFNYIREREKYKWDFLKSFQLHFNIESKDFYENLSNALELSDNLLIAGSAYMPKTVILKIAKRNPEVVRQLFKDLSNPDEDLVERMNTFLNKTKILAIECQKQGILKYPRSHQDAHAISVYLTMIFPETYYIYKTSMFCDFTRKIKYHITPSSKGGVNNIPAYVEMCHEIETQLFANKTLMELHGKWLETNGFVGIDPANHMLTQDFVYAVFVHFDVLKLKVVPNQPKSGKVEVTRIEANELTVKPMKNTSFTSIRDNDYFNNHKRQKQLGNFGEIFVVEYEKRFLQENGRKDLAEKVEHVSMTKGDGLGYDVLSYDLNGRKKFIEVKTTRGALTQEFFVTSTELAFSKQNSGRFWLYRVYKFNEQNNTANIEMIHGDISNLCQVPATYCVRLNKTS